LLDDQRLGDAHYGLARQDVGSAFPDWPDSLRSGYAFHCPPRSLRNGEHVVQLNLRARSGQVLEHRFSIQVRKSEDVEEGQTVRRSITQVEKDLAEDLLNNLGQRPCFQLILHQAGDIDTTALLPTIDSLREQVYRHWKLTILTPGRVALAEVGLLLGEAAADLSDRINVGCRLLNQRFGLRSLLGRERESRLQAAENMTGHLGWRRRTKKRS